MYSKAVDEYRVGCNGRMEVEGREEDGLTAGVVTTRVCVYLGVCLVPPTASTDVSQ